MFNTTRIAQAPAYPQTVTEKRAPTDESVRILMELEAAAEKRVVERGKMENNEVSFNWIVLEKPMDLHTYECICRFKLNGFDHEHRFDFNPRKYSDHIEMCKDLIEIVSKRVATILLMGFSKDHLHLFKPQGRL